MRIHPKLAFAGLVAVLVMSMAAGTAAANRSLSLNNGGTRTFEYSGRYTFAEPGGAFNFICTYLRKIRFLREAIPKTERTEIGTAEVSVRECSGGTVILLEARAWKVRYISFSGTLPRISRITLQIDPGERGGFLLSVFFGIARCLYGAPVNSIAAVNAAGELTELRSEEAPLRPTVNLGGSECPEGIRRGTLTPLAGTPAIRLRLV